jgi:hypothetical protein
MFLFFVRFFMLFLVTFSLSPSKFFFSVSKKIYCVHENVVLFIILKYKLLSHLKSFKKKCTLSHSYEHPALFHYDLLVIFIPNSTQISGFFYKKILLSVTIYWPTFIPNILLFYNFCHSEHQVYFLYVGKS